MNEKEIKFGVVQDRDEQVRIYIIWIHGTNRVHREDEEKILFCSYLNAFIKSSRLKKYNSTSLKRNVKIYLK